MPSLPQEEVVLLPTANLVRGFFQPRDYFDDLAMESTRRSIKEKGQMYPVIVRVIKLENPLFDPLWTQIHYELADGERRYRCCKDLGLKDIKAIVRDLSDEQMLDYTLSTNDSLPLNAIERAQVFLRLTQEFGKSQEDIAKSFNMKQQQVSEFVRLLELPSEVQDLTARAVISIRHAREILKVSDSEIRLTLGLEVAVSGMSTRELSKRVRAILEKESNISHDIEKNSVKMTSNPNKIEEEAQDRLKYRPKDDLFTKNVENISKNSIILRILTKIVAFIIKNVLISWSKSIDKTSPGSLELISRSIAAAQLAVFLASTVLLTFYMIDPWVALLAGASCGAVLIYIYIERS